jgi:hypothetical protein
MHKYTNGTPVFKIRINNIKGFGASFQKVRKTGKSSGVDRSTAQKKPRGKPRGFFIQRES